MNAEICILTYEIVSVVCSELHSGNVFEHKVYAEDGLLPKVECSVNLDSLYLQSQTHQEVVLFEFHTKKYLDLNEVQPAKAHLQIQSLLLEYLQQFHNEVLLR